MTDWPRPSVTVDVAAFQQREDGLYVLLIERGHPPFEGRWALPGGFVDVTGGQTGQGEDLPDAALRELEEETGVQLVAADLVEVGVFGEPGRDPRGRTITICYAAMLPADVTPRAGDDAAKAEWQRVEDVDLPGLAFDHDVVLERALAAIQAR
jgi:8-oxo-dGTP diphosphatase